ncbi:hypothetical protein KFU94_23850 [Chloroflexi bacterium TSY]|nr:hypothetical protein [Chloroflexi bacterium TSY]
MRRASEWCEATDLVGEAVQYALVAEDFERVASLIAQHADTIMWQGWEMGTLAGWLDALPEKMVRANPHLSLTRAWLLFELAADRAEAIEDWLQTVETFLSDKGVCSSSESPIDKDRSGADVFEAQDILSKIDLLRANLARRRGDATQAITLCQRALTRTSAEQRSLRGAINYVLAATYDSIGSMGESRIYAESIALSRTIDDDYVMVLSDRLIEALSVQGQLRRAHSVFQEMTESREIRQGPAAGMACMSASARCCASGINWRQRQAI